MAVLGVDFKHLSTNVNGVGKRHINSRDLFSAVRPIVAHLCSLQERSTDTRHVAAPAVHRFLLVAGIGFLFCPTSGRYWRTSLSDIVLLLSSLASIFSFSCSGFACLSPSQERFAAIGRTSFRHRPHLRRTQILR